MSYLFYLFKVHAACDYFKFCETKKGLDNVHSFDLLNEADFGEIGSHKMTSTRFMKQR